MRERLLVMTAAAVLGVSAGPAVAATLTVNTAADESPAGDGLCSLREAIEAVDSPGSGSVDCAPAAFGANTIVLGPGTYTQYAPTATASELTIASTVTSLTIQGAGESRTIIGDLDVNGTRRLLSISGGAKVVLENLTLTGSHAPDGAAGAKGKATSGGAGQLGSDGGAILNAGSLTMVDAAVTDSQAGAGGAGGNVDPLQPGNPAGAGGPGGTGGAGGAIDNTGTLTLTGVTLSGDQAGAGGAGGAGAPGQATVSGGAGGAGGDGGSGGALFNSGGAVTISRTTIGGASAGAGGDGGSGGDSASGGGGTGAHGGAGGAGAGGGGISSSGGTVSVTNSTVVSDVAGAGGSGGAGGQGIASASVGGDGGAGGDGGGGDGGGGGGVFAVGNAAVALLNVTVVGNDAGAGGAGGSVGNGTTAGADGTAGSAGPGGGVDGVPAASITLQNSLLALNQGGNCGVASVLTDLGHNLSSGDATCPSGFATGDPNLGPLQNNGGPTETISLGAGSAAIDQVPASGAGCPATDQRGVPRPSGKACDIGSYEVAPPVVSTGAATDVGRTGATANASVTPNAGVATVHFDYGTSTQYSSHSADQQTAGVSPVAVSATLRGLKPNTTYHFRVVAVTMDGTSYGADQTFKTTLAPTISALTIAPSAFRPARSGRAIVRRGGATVSYTDTQAAKVSFTIVRIARHNKPVGTFTHRDRAGADSFHFSGRLNGRALSPGRYWLEATARAHRQTGATAKVRFRVIG
jgi:CSLREA domain-containing protein